MSVKADVEYDLRERVIQFSTQFRVVLMMIAVVALAGFIHNLRAFWYGAPLVIIGELIQMWASSQVHKNLHLTVSGPYSHVRNPMYIGRFCIGLGIMIMTANVYLIVGFLIAFFGYGRLRVGREEARLRDLFGEQYEHYCTEIRRWLPRLKPYSRSESKNATWEQICVTHENINLIVVLLALIGLYFRITKIPWHL